MSILIKGMKMPETCMYGGCPIDGKYCDLWWKMGGGEYGRHRDCPLVEIPDHGDLIDRDEQIERAWRLELNTRELIAEMLNTATVVIPAERSAKVCPLHSDDEVTEYCVEGPCMDETEDRCPIAERSEDVPV